MLRVMRSGLSWQRCGESGEWGCECHGRDKSAFSQRRRRFSVIPFYSLFQHATRSRLVLKRAFRCFLLGLDHRAVSVALVFGVVGHVHCLNQLSTGRLLEPHCDTLGARLLEGHRDLLHEFEAGRELLERGDALAVLERGLKDAALREKTYKGRLLFEYHHERRK